MALREGELASSQECGQWQAKGLQASQDPHTLYVSPLSLVHTHMNLKHATHVPAHTPHTHTPPTCATHATHTWGVGIKSKRATTSLSGHHSPHF